MDRLRADDYLTRDHMLRDLGMILEYKEKGSSMARIPVAPSVCNDRGAMQVGVLAILIDIASGALAARAVYPDLAVTGDLRIYSTQPARTGEATAVGSVLRAGRAAVVVEAEIIAGIPEAGGTSPSIGSAIATFYRLSRRDGNINMVRDVISQQVTTFRAEGPALSQHLLERAGMRVIDEAVGLVELNMSEYVRNHFGALEGGMIALLADVAGQCAARTITHKPMITTDLAICYLSQGRTGPFYTRTEVLRTTEDSVLTRVGIFDRGADDLLMSIAMNTATIA